jgi:hypothetical protein
MSIFKKAESTTAYLKAGFLGFAGSGKTTTATETAIGLVNMLREKNLPEGGRPVFFLDTETGADYVKRRFDDAGIELFTAKTRAFMDLIPAIREAEKGGAALIIDSITHFWREFTEAYAKRKNRPRLEFQDWNYLKTEWGKFTDAYINSSAHILLCGRAGYEYDFFEDQDGKKQLEKTGIKMKAEAEMGYEPSLLVLMERQMNMEDKKVHREGHVIKERFGIIDGKTFKNPSFKDFLPHIERLNLGGMQLGVDTTRTSEGMIETGTDSWPQEKRQREIFCEEIKNLCIKHGLDGTASEVKKRRLNILESCFGTAAWTAIENMKSERIKDGFEQMKQILGQPVNEETKTEAAA